MKQLKHTMSGLRASLALLLLLLLTSVAAIAQDRTITGRVLDEMGEGLPGAVINVKGTSIGTATDVDGNFSLNVPSGSNILTVKSISYADQEVPVGNGNIVVQMRINAKELEGAVVVGYGTQRREAISGSVSVVEGEELENKPFASFQNILQGKAAGVQVTGQNGRPGSNAFIRIRGVGSLTASAAPLIVIDGQPVSVEAYNSLNPNDIENISILKDASTNAIYGSRGSNGVIMITTKKGRSSAPQISYTFQYGVRSKTHDNFKLMDFDQKLQYERDLGYANPYIQEYMVDNGYDNIQDIPDGELQGVWNNLRSQRTNWFKAILRPAQYVTNDLAISGGTDKTKVYFSFQNYKEEGISIGSDFLRRSGRINVTHQFNDFFEAGTNIMVAYKKENLLRDLWNDQNPFYAIYGYNEYDPVFGPDGEYNLVSNTGFNVIEAIRNNPESAGTLNSVTTTYGQLRFLKNFKLRSEFSTEYTNFKREYFIQPGSVLDGYIGNPDKPGIKTDNGSTRFNYRWANTLAYNATFGENHTFSAIAGTEFTDENFSSYSIESIGYPNATNNVAAVAAENTAFSTNKAEWALFSMFGRAEYSFANKYFVNGSIRRDGSSRFSRDNQFGNFYAGGFSWVASREKFLQNSKTISLLRAFASIGTSGNQEIGNYTALFLNSFGKYNGSNAFYPAQPGNNDLTWEKGTLLSAGIDFGFFQNRITGTAAYFNRNTNLLILDRRIPSTTGFSVRNENVGDVRNYGAEFELAGDVIRAGDFTWNLRGNLTLQRNRITKLIPGVDSLQRSLTYYKVGDAVDEYYFVRDAGIDPETGAPLYYTKDGEITVEYSADDAVILKDKTPMPKFYGGITSTFAYKGLSLSAEIYYSGGNYIYNYNWLVLHSGLDGVPNPQAEDALNYWKNPGDQAAYANPLTTNIENLSTDKWLQKGDFIRLRNVTLAYSIPNHLTQKVRVKNLSIFLQGQNLFYWNKEYKGDPEIGIGSDENQGQDPPGSFSLFTYPQVRTISFGLNATF